MGHSSGFTDEAPPTRPRHSVVRAVFLSGFAVLLGIFRPVAILLRLFAVAGIVMALSFQLLNAPNFPFWTILAVCSFVFLVGLFADALRHAVNSALAERDQNSRS